MTLSRIDDPSAVKRAISEFDEIGREAFLSKYGFGKSREYFLRLDGGKLYDSKAIIGAAHSYAFPNEKPLSAKAFSGGELTVKKKLEQLGFEVVRGEAADTLRASSSLVAGNVYTREDLKALFGFTDATINNGVFHPKGYNSVFLFVTEKKTPDRTQFLDLLNGDTLQWQGQTMGRTDHKIIGHQQDGVELLLFYRREKYEHPNAAFRFEGSFDYVSHSGGNPTSFILRRAQNPALQDAQDRAEQEGAFDPTSAQDARQRTMAAIVRRQGQAAFRQALMTAYGSRCAITDCDVPEALEAAHIFPFKGDHTNHVTNGLLLRADLHTLFDLGLIAIDAATMTVITASKLEATHYGALNGKSLRAPEKVADHPSGEALAWHRNQAGL